MKTLRALVALPIILLAAMAVCAQTLPVAPSPSGFVASSDAMAIGCNGAWSAGNLTTESYDLLDFGATKSNRVFAQGVQLLAPSCGFAVYGAGAIVQPDITQLLKRTNIPVGNLVTFVDLSAGNGIPSSGSDHVAVIVGAGVKYILTDNMTWNSARFEEVFFGSQRYTTISTGISAYFGGTPASAVASPNVNRSLVRRIASAAARVKQ